MLVRHMQALLRRARRHETSEAPPPLMRGNSRYQDYEIGEWTYGTPEVLQWKNSATLRVGRFCSIAKGVQIFLGGEHRTDWLTTYPFPEFWDVTVARDGYSATKGDVSIGHDVWIGRDALILSGVTIGNGAVVGAAAVVASNVPCYAVVAGNPARTIRMRFAPELVIALEQIAWWNWSDKDIRRAMRFLLSNDAHAFIREFALSRNATTAESQPR